MHSKIELIKLKKEPQIIINYTIRSVFFKYIKLYNREDLPRSSLIFRIVQCNIY